MKGSSTSVLNVVDKGNKKQTLKIRVFRVRTGCKCQKAIKMSKWVSFWNQQFSAPPTRSFSKNFLQQIILDETFSVTRQFQPRLTNVKLNLFSLWHPSFQILQILSNFPVFFSQPEISQPIERKFGGSCMEVTPNSTVKGTDF